MNRKDGVLKRMRTALITRRCINGNQGRAGKLESGGKGSPTELDVRMLTSIREAGLALPLPERASWIKSSLVSKVAAVQEQAPVIGTEGQARRGAIPLHKRMPAVAKVAVAAAMVLALLLTVGLSSSYAMPGNPLYSAKRAIEKAHLFLTPAGESKANTCLSYADRRLGELEYVMERQMRDWYLPLASDAENLIGESRKETSSLEKDDSDKILDKAASLLAGLESILKDISADLPTGQREALERGLDKAKEALDKARGGPPKETDVPEVDEGTRPQEVIPETPGVQPDTPRPQPDDTPGPPENTPRPQTDTPQPMPVSRQSSSVG